MLIAAPPRFEPAPVTSATSATLAMPAIRGRADIQGLRAVAVLLVVLAHAGVPGISGGFIGVDVFFVLSGYLITSILLHEATTDGAVSLIGFYGKRARRILPAATATLIVTAVVATLTLAYVRADLLLKDILWTAFFGANIHFAQQNTDYFAVDAPASPVQHFWSLAVEEQFYVVWPALLVIVLVAGARGHAEGVRRRIPVLRLLLALIVFASLIWSVIRTASAPDSAYFSTLARSWELGAGALLALAGRSLPLLTPRIRGLLSLGGLAMVLWAAFTFTERTPVPGYHIALPVLGTVALLAAGAGVTGSHVPWISRLLGHQPLRWIGDVSYGFYLWHWPFLVLPVAYTGHRLGLGQNLLLATGALLAAWVSYHLIENPIRRAKSLARHHRRALLLWPVTVLSVLAANSGAHGYFDYVRSKAAERSESVDVSDLPTAQRVPRNGNEVHDAVAEAVDRISLDAPPVAPLAQDLTDVLGDRYSRDESCTAREPDTEHELCVIGDPTADRTMVLIGDSHAQMWLTPLDQIAERNGYRLVPLIKLGCSPYDLTEWMYDKRMPFAACTEYQAWADQQLAQLDPDVVIAGGATARRTVDPATQSLLPPKKSAPLVRGGVAAAVRDWRRIAKTVRVLGDVPRPPFVAAYCLSDLDNTAADCSFGLPENTVTSNDLVRSGVAVENARYVDVVDMFCLKQICPTVVGDIVVYADDAHMTATYGAWLADAVETGLRLPN